MLSLYKGYCMAHMIEISDSCNGLLTVTLPMLLAELGMDGANLSWSILYLSATGDLGEGESIVDFEDYISNSPDGFCLGWRELNDLSAKFDQIFDMLIAGASDKGSIKKYTNEEDLYSNYEVVLDLFDGAYWKVYAEDEALIDRLAKKFTEIKISK